MIRSPSPLIPPRPQRRFSASAFPCSLPKTNAFSMMRPFSSSIRVTRRLISDGFRAENLCERRKDIPARIRAKKNQADDDNRGAAGKNQKKLLARDEDKTYRQEACQNGLCRPRERCIRYGCECSSGVGNRNWGTPARQGEVVSQLRGQGSSSGRHFGRSRSLRRNKTEAKRDKEEPGAEDDEARR